MDLHKAKAMLDEALNEHGLSYRGWVGRFDEAKKRFGMCSPGRKEISLSRPLVELNDEDEVRDTILHEIAHALADLEHGEACGHDERWKVVCRRIGARPERCFDDSVPTPDAPWVLVHRETGEIHGSFQRKPARDFSQAYLRGRKAETLGRLELRANQAAIENSVIENFDAAQRTALRERAEHKMRELAEAHGLEAEVTKGSYSSHEYSLTFKFSIPLPEGADPVRDEFELLCSLFGLTPEDYKRPFRHRGKTYLLTGFKPRNRKYPVLGINETGQCYKFDLEVLESLE